IDIINHKGWLVHSADQIFSVTRVDSRLPADRAIHNCKKRRRDLNMRNTAMINRRDESGDVTDHAATETDDERFAIQSSSDHLLANCSDLLERFRLLACWNRDGNGPKACGY